MERFHVASRMNILLYHRNIHVKQTVMSDFPLSSQQIKKKAGEINQADSHCSYYTDPRPYEFNCMYQKIEIGCS